MSLDDAAQAAQMPIIGAAASLLKSLYVDADLRAAWPRVHPSLRLCWVQGWAVVNRQALEEHGYALDEVARSMALIDGPAHPLWGDFARVLLRDLKAASPIDLQAASIGTETRVLGIDVELLYVHTATPETCTWEAGAAAEVVPLVMKLTDGDWQVLNIGSEAVPVPGWPPRLGGEESR